jgi:hypothetical protein
VRPGTLLQSQKVLPLWVLGFLHGRQQLLAFMVLADDDSGRISVDG